MSRAVFSGSALAIPNHLARNQGTNADLFIGLQGAFSIDRFLVGEGLEGSPYAASSRTKANKVVLTSSVYDNAVDRAGWADMAGNDKSYNKICGPGNSYNDRINCLTAQETGMVTPSFATETLCPTTASPSSCRIDYVLADNLVRYNMVGTGGGAHSDVYRPEMGRLIWEAIKAFASPTSGKSGNH
ncbi:MAG: hypothetical protein HQL74_14495 [Magnetococcales bacterium]|nr:hypothetical protein [Magnetococcales bacterium]